MFLNPLKTKAIGPLSFLFVFFLVSTGYSQESPGSGYIVKEGDTLWGISSSHYSDPFLWPKLWGKNLAISHPDKIYPGQKIVLPSEEFLKEVEKNNQGVETEKPSERIGTPETPELQASIVPFSLQPEISEPEPEAAAPVSALTETDLLTSGFILKDSAASGKTGEIIASENQHALLGEGDVVYLSPVSSHTFHIGERYSIYESVRSIHHPKSHRLMGKLIRVKGFVEIIPNQIPGSRKETFSAVIVKSFDLISLKDLLIPYQPMDLIDLTLPFPKELRGTIVGTRDLKENSGPNDFVYLDKGSRDGIQRGHLFVVVKDGKKIPFYSPDGRERLPQRIIAELEVVSVQKETSTAIIAKSIEPVVVGDQISNPPPATP